MKRFTLIGCSAIMALSSSTFTLASAEVAEWRQATHEVRVGGIPRIETAGTIDAVTVYRGQALITRTVQSTGEGGLRELVVTDLPAQIVPGSLFAEGTGNAEIRSVRYLERPVTQDVREQVREIEGRMRALRDELQTVERRLRSIEEQRAYMAKLEQFAAPTASSDLSKGVLDAAALRELTLFIREQRSELADAQLAQEFQQRDVRAAIEQLQRELNTLGSTSARTAREAVVLINAPGAGDASVQLHYLVNRATWEPSYTVRGNAGQGRIGVEYYASIQQTSGEDWSNVSMTLSTATPSLVALAPRLTALPISLQQQAGPPRDGLMDNRMLITQRAELDRARGQSDFGGGGRSGAAEYGRFDDQMNELAGQIQLNEMLGFGDTGHAAITTNEGLSVSYRLGSRSSLPSRSDRQLIQIASMPMEGDFYKLAIPVLTSYVYDEASTTNRSEHVLLAGPVSTYANGSFVGHSTLSDTTIGEQMKLGFGVNSSFRSDRQLVHQEESVQGGNRVVDVTYRLTIENFSDAPTVIRLLDRLPQVKQNEIKLTILNDGVSGDADVRHHAHDRAEGILRWDVEVPANAIAEHAMVIEYTLRLEYDRQMTIVTSAGN